MGIPGLINELGSGDRISLAKVAIDHLERTSRPIRVAIDISIWLFQVRAGRGGVHPELRVLFYRLVRLVALPIHPIFVFDGPRRPSYKRGKVVAGCSVTGPDTSPNITRLSKQLLDLFRFPSYTAPGEAEAECARLQMAGVVDAVMSDDVDSLMFGSNVTIMNFSKESSTGTKAATHVNLYRTKAEGGQQANVSLDRGGMILFALMSGGDYLPAGVQKCGPKIAAQIANARFGTDLLEIIYSNGTDIDIKLNKWRERLWYELRENKSGFFRKRHRAVQIPDGFPDRKILSCYAHPIVSSTEQLEAIRRSLVWDQNIDVSALWKFVGETLKWKHISGVKKFIKAFAAPLVSHRLRLHLPLVAGFSDTSLPNDVNLISPKIYKGRALYATDGLSELQLEIVPADVVGIRFDCQIHPQLWQDEESGYSCSDSEIASIQRTSYEPTQLNKIWVFEAIAKLGIPDAVKTWEIAKQAKLVSSQTQKPKKPASQARKKRPLDPGMKEGEILRYGVIAKKSAIESDPKVTSTPKSSSMKQLSEPYSLARSQFSSGTSQQL